MSTGSKWKSALLVSMQMVCILLLLLTIPFMQCDWWALSLSGLGILLGFWAVAAMQLGNVSVMPDVKEDARMVTAGPYKAIRHPMYAAVLLTFTPLVLDCPTWTGGGLLTLLWATLLIKLNYEEQLLKQHFKAYPDYASHTWRIVPFVY